MPFKKKWEHYWFYYKWHTVIALLAALLIGYSVYSAVTQTKYDLYIDMMCKDISFDIAENIGRALEKSDAVKDINGDGEKHVNTALVAFSSAGDSSQDIQQMQVVQVRMLVGESTVLFVGNDFLDSYTEQGVFADITEIADRCNIPDEARFKDNSGATVAVRLKGNKLMFDSGTPAEDSYIAMRNISNEHKKDKDKVKEYEIAPGVIEYILKQN